MLMVREYRHLDDSLVQKPYEIYDEMYLPHKKLAWMIDCKEKTIARLVVIWENGKWQTDNIIRDNYYSRLKLNRFFTCNDFFNPTQVLDLHIPKDGFFKIRKLKYVARDTPSYYTFKNVNGVSYYIKNSSDYQPIINNTYISMVMKEDNKNSFWFPIFEINSQKIFRPYCYDIWDFGNLKDK